MKKIGIVTITGEANIGNSLQNYALSTLVQHFKYRTITLLRPFSSPDNLKIIVKTFVKQILKYNNDLSWRRYRFNHFRRKYIEVEKALLSEAKEINALKYDGFIFGSDQIWNMNLGITSKLDFFFGTFAPKEKKIAYSASIGTDFIPAEYETYFTNAIRDFAYISVREEKAAQLIEQYTGRKVPVTLDPTLLLSCREWLKISKRPKYIAKSEKFVLVYFLGAVPDTAKQLLDDVCRQYNLRQIDLYSEWCVGNEELLKNRTFKENEYFTNPSEFIWLISHCSLMVTDSFHGSVFSILFQKPFRCFDRQESGIEKMNSRMQTLFSQFHVADWCIGREGEDLEHIFDCDFSSVDSVLEREREKSLNYLREALNSL